MFRAATRLAKRLNWARRRWSAASDREFHDALFSTQTYDPLSPSYPGYLTIRRFADLAASSARDGDTILDLGCGTGEITCELARRLPRCQFIGIDHSHEGVSQGQRLAARLDLSNVFFKVGDMERYELDKPVTLVTMFDSFHHLLDPGRFVQRLALRCDRFFLIEPAGDWLGGWKRTIDLDWVTEALLTIRERLEYQFGLSPLRSGVFASTTVAGEPVEHRHSLDDFYHWFEGFGVDIRGTVAGLELYGSAPYLSSPLRDDFGACIYQLIVDLELVLKRHELDLGAKHWAIAAERGREIPARRISFLSTQEVQRPLSGPYDATYSGYAGPTEARKGSMIETTLHVMNRSWRIWDSRSNEEPIFASYHWLDPKGFATIEDGLRSPLPRPLIPADSCDVALRVLCPDKPGNYTLSIDFVHEGICWFSGTGVAPLRVPIRVTE